MRLPDKLGDSEMLIAVGALSILGATTLAAFGKIDGMALAAVVGAVLGSSAVAGFRDTNRTPD